jgi:2-polyprenyl-3-methyl-5-hydroxy-6-metoxy-1,4-benzoquinol methylase
MDSGNVFDYIYQKEGAAPWTFSEPPKELVKLVESSVLKPCKMLDVGCGEGYISSYFASKGFDVTGVDASGNAINFAKKHAKELGVKCKFLRMDWKELSGSYDFILDWRFLHEITDEEERKEYVKLVSRLLVKDGIYLSAAFSGEFKKWGKGKLRKSPTGVVLCLASSNDLEKLFGTHFNIAEKKMIKLPQKEVLGGITSYSFLMKKK